MAQHRYGIHTMENEHFGIGVAEMVRAGCIPFVHDSGGPVEIVGGRSELRFRDAPEGAAAMAVAMRDGDLPDRMRGDPMNYIISGLWRLVSDFGRSGEISMSSIKANHCHAFLSLRSWRLCERYSSSVRTDSKPEAFVRFLAKTPRSQRKKDNAA